MPNENPADGVGAAACPPNFKVGAGASEEGAEALLNEKPVAGVGVGPPNWKAGAGVVASG